MKKSISLLFILLAVATLLLTGCSSKGDFELKRSERVSITYVEEIIKMSITPVSLTSDEIIHSYSNAVVRGTIESVRNIQIDYGKGEVQQKAIAEIKVTKVLSGNAAVDSIVKVLLPAAVDNASAGDSSILLSHFKNGVAGIFLLKEVTEQSCAQMGKGTFYYDDICEYSMFGADQFAIIMTDGTVRFNANMFDGEANAFSTLDEAEAKLQSIIGGN